MNNLHPASMYTGSMFGKPALVFAVWGFAISHLRPSRTDGACYVELNPSLLAATFSTTVDAVVDALNILCAPDPDSETPLQEGRRLVRTDDKRTLGAIEFLVVGGEKYSSLRDEVGRRVYLREAKRKQRSDSSKLSAEAALTVALPSCLDTEDGRAAWKEFVVYRYEKIRVPWKTDRGPKAQLKVLSDQSTDVAIEAINRTMDREWQGVDWGLREVLRDRESPSLRPKRLAPSPSPAPPDRPAPELAAERLAAAKAAGIGEVERAYKARQINNDRPMDRAQADAYIDRINAVTVEDCVFEKTIRVISLEVGNV